MSTTRYHYLAELQASIVTLGTKGELIVSSVYGQLFENKKSILIVLTSSILLNEVC